MMEPVKRTLPLLKLDANESPLAPPDWLRAALRSAAEEVQLARYPDRHYEALRGEIARAYDLESAQITVANGSGEILLNLCLLAKKLGIRRALAPRPTFGLYRTLVERVGLEYREVPTGFGEDLDAERLLTGADGQAVVCFLARPNNPCGTLWSEDAMEAVGNGLPKGSLWVIDEAYAEFAGVDLTAWSRNRPGCVVVRTLSKAYALAGLRVGFAAASPEIGRMLEDIRLPYPVDLVAERIAREVVRRRGELEHRSREIAAWRDLLASRLDALVGISVQRGQANFLLIHCEGCDGEDMRKRLAERGIRVRSYSGIPELANCVRITVCPPEDMERVVEAFRLSIADESKDARDSG